VILQGSGQILATVMDDFKCCKPPSSVDQDSAMELIIYFCRERDGKF